MPGHPKQEVYAAVIPSSLRLRAFLAFGLLASCALLAVELGHLFGVPWLGSQGLYQTTRANLVDALDDSAETRRLALEAWLQERRSDLRFVGRGWLVERLLDEYARNPDPGALPKLPFYAELRNRLAQLAQAGGYDGVEVVDLEAARVLVTTAAETPPARPAAAPALITRASAGRAELFFETTEGAGGHPELHVGLRLPLHRSGAAPGAALVVIRVGLERALGILADKGHSTDRAEYGTQLLDGGCRVLIPTDHPERNAGGDGPGTVERLALEGNGATADGIDHRGVPVAAGYRRIQVAPGVVWGLLVKADATEVTERFYEGMLRFLIMDALILILLVGLSWAAARRLTAPVSALVGAARRVEEGDLGARAPVSADGGELAALAFTFNRMATRVEGWRTDLDRELAERTAEVRASEQRFRALFDSSPVPMVIVRHADQVPLLVNQRWTEELGFTQEAIPESEPWWSGLFPDPAYREHVCTEWNRRLLEAAAHHAPVAPLEVRVRGRDGAERDVEWHTAVLIEAQAEVLILTFSDLTRHKRAEQELRQYAERNRALMESAHDAIFIARSDGRLADVNRRAESLTGYSREQLLRMNTIQLHPRGEWERALTLFAEAMVVDALLVELPIERNDGVQVPVEISASALRIGNERYLLEVFRDVTERVEREGALTRAREGAEEANRAKGNFLAGVSHELRTPLNVILGYGALLGRDARLPGDVLEKLRMVDQSGRRLLELINDILDFSGAEGGGVALRPEPFRLQALVAEIDGEFRPRVEGKGLAFDLLMHSLHPGGLFPETLRADRIRLLQVLRNLLDNARRFTLQGGIALTLTVAEGRLRVEVADTGPGILPDERERIFLPFQHGGEGRPHEGAGLGLAVCRRLITAMGGRLELESQAGVGSRFFFEIAVPTQGWGATELCTDWAQTQARFDPERSGITDACPPREVLETLMQAVRSGRVREVERRLEEQMEACDPTMLPFWRHARELIGGFRLKELRMLLDGKLARHQANGPAGPGRSP